MSLKQDTNEHRNFATTIKERNENFARQEKDSDYGYTSSSRFRPIDSDVSGAEAIRVQDIPNGVLGRPVEFESKWRKSISMAFQESFHASLHLFVSFHCSRRIASWLW